MARCPSVRRAVSPDWMTVEKLKIETEHTDEHQARLTVEIETERLDQAKRRAARIISRRTKIPGFRPGKAPYAIVQRHVGDGVVLEEALDLLIDDLYPQVIEQSDIQPYGPGRLEDLPSTDPPVFTFVVPLAPEVELGEYAKIRKPYELPATTEEDVAEVLERLREDQAIIEPVDRPAAEGDVVYLHLTARDEAAEPDAEPMIAEQQLNLLVLSSEDEKSTDKEWPFPGFSQSLIGHAAGDELEIEHSYPDEEQHEEFQGRQVTFQINIDEIKSRELPDLDDELAQTAGEYETLAELTDYIRETLENNARQAYNESYDDEILEELVNASSIRFPALMVENETQHIKRRLQNQLAAQGLDLDVYLKSREMSEEDLAEELRPDAERRIRRGLAILNLAEAENIEVSRSDVEDELTETLAQFSRLRGANASLSAQEVEDLAERLIGDRMTALAVERLRMIARGAQELQENGAEAADEPEQEGLEDQTAGETPMAQDEPAAQGAAGREEAAEPGTPAADKEIEEIESQ